MFRPALDPASPTPLYHQIAEAVRYEIATGRVRAGETLPPLRAAADRWGVNLHTVRQAYLELAEMGLVRISRPRGAVVLEAAAGPGGAGAAARRFAARVAREGREKHGLSAAALAGLIGEVDGAGARHTAVGDDRANIESAPMHVIECSDTQAADLAAQVAERFAVEARPWCLDRAGALPDGALIATYFHYNDLRRRAPERMAGTRGIRFVAIRVDPALGARVKRVAGTGRAGAPGAPERGRIWLVEQDEQSARTIAADVRVAVGEAENISPAPLVVERAGAALERAGARDALLMSPRMWGALTPEQRRDRRVLEVRYLIDEEDLERIGADLGLKRRGESAGGAKGRANKAVGATPRRGRRASGRQGAHS